VNEQEKQPDTNIHTVIIQTARMEEMAEFYGRGLGLGEPAATGDDHLGYPLQNVYFGFDRVEQAPTPSGVISLWFEVEDIKAAFHQFQELGSEVKYAPSKKPWGAVLAALYDPDGNVFGLTQRGTNPEY
jgi:catechol 2,3-dioxygenase-like lactoylglutathione lyase family enzyme